MRQQRQPRRLCVRRNITPLWEARGDPHESRHPVSPAAEHRFFADYLLFYHPAAGDPKDPHRQKKDPRRQAGPGRALRRHQRLLHLYGRQRGRHDREHARHRRSGGGALRGPLRRRRSRAVRRGAPPLLRSRRLHHRGLLSLHAERRPSRSPVSRLLQPRQAQTALRSTARGGGGNAAHAADPAPVLPLRPRPVGGEPDSPAHGAPQLAGTDDLHVGVQPALGAARPRFSRQSARHAENRRREPSLHAPGPCGRRVAGQGDRHHPTLGHLRGRNLQRPQHRPGQRLDWRTRLYQQRRRPASVPGTQGARRRLRTRHQGRPRQS